MTTIILVLLIALGIALSGCTTTQSTIPGQLLTCASQPASPQAGTQRDVALCRRLGHGR